MRIRILPLITLVSLLLALPVRSPAASETNAETAEVSAAAAETSASNDTLRAYLQLQEQLHATQLAIEQTRRQVEEANAKSANELANQLHSFEQSLSAQRTQEAHFMMYVLSSLAGISFLAVVITAYFQWRTVNRLADFTAALPMGRSLGAVPAAGTLGFGENALLSAGTVEQSNGKLLSAIERLENRIRELEHTATPALNGDFVEAPSESNGESSNSHTADGSISAPDFTSEAVDQIARVKQLLYKGQSLLHEEKADAAIECFDQVLALEAGNTEALVKKGAALEKLRKLPEAIECYDRAIAVDGSMTIAYLHKGGIYNRMERFGEAVECYEKALRTQEKRSAA
jgi:tetratricopeptide (TPR) repeat protein